MDNSSELNSFQDLTLTDTFTQRPDDDIIAFQDTEPLTLKKKKKDKNKKKNKKKNKDKNKDKKDQNKSLYIINNRKMSYNDRTMEYYRVIRKLLRDPITYDKLSEDKCFKVPYMWDPYTGERLGPDPYGPLCIDPDNLIHYFYISRLKKLWMNPSDEVGGFYQGTYDDAVGIGEDFYFRGRGHFPEWYIFRLPIIDCYLNKDHMRQAITLGPKLTYEDVLEIDRLASLNKLSYQKRFRKKRPLLANIWKYYHIAINDEPNILNSDDMTMEQLKTARTKASMAAVDVLRKM